MGGPHPIATRTEQTDKAEWPILRSCFDRVFHAIDTCWRSGGKCVIVCDDARSRSPALLIAYLLRCCPALSYDDIFLLVADSRPIVTRAFETELRAYAAARLPLPWDIS